MQVIKDLRILEAIAKRFNLQFDKTFKYNIGQDFYGTMEYKGRKFKLKYFDGCFYPFLIELK
jgi:hypothetical protein